MGFVKLLLLAVLTCGVSAEAAAGVCTTEHTTAAPQTDIDETTTIPLDKNTTTGENTNITESTSAPKATTASANTTTNENTPVLDTTIQPATTNTSKAADTSSTTAVNTTQTSVSTTEPDTTVTIKTTIMTDATTTAESTAKPSARRKRQAITQECVANADCLSGDTTLTCHCRKGHTAGSDVRGAFHKNINLDKNGVCVYSTATSCIALRGFRRGCFRELYGKTNNPSTANNNSDENNNSNVNNNDGTSRFFTCCRHYNTTRRANH
ncbi:hypothetical protein MAR_012897 [Mya arenaria]|uniref:Uncharacterized protein n=1 Tax=Mya arenaria TaxID=6604 RepID=A0ABY7FYA9_MYAAR|nr:hypothetical protein MAR_012897 [Mya arenaria]